MTNSAWFGIWWGCDPCVWPRFQPACQSCQSQPGYAVSGSTERQLWTKCYILSVTWENGRQWHIYKRVLCSIHITFEKNFALFRQRQALTLMWEWCAEWLTELLSDAVAEAPVSRQLWKSRVKGQTGGETRKHSESDCWGGEAGWVCADSTEDPSWHNIKKCFPVVLSEINTDQSAAKDTGGVWETRGLR